jgi:membrane associated rhomboid family serine protease
MGIYDRDYIRRAPPGPARGAGLGGMRMWSVTTWIIVVCVLVYVVDGFLPYQLVKMRGPFLPPDIQGLPETWVIDGSPTEQTIRIPEPDGGYHVETMWVRPVLDRPGGVQIGWWQVHAMRPIEAAMHFSTARAFRRAEVWRFVGFQFLHTHVTIFHLLFNMVGLYFFGPIAERYLGRKRYLAFYLLCGIFGALLYLLLNLGGFIVSAIFGADTRVPGLIFNSPYTPLIGASAGVFGVIMAGAYLAPRTTVLLFFFLPMQLRTLAYAVVLIAFITVLTGGANAGGEAGHLGGAIAGFYFIRHPHHLHGFFDILGRIDPTSHHYRRGGRVARPRGGPPRQEVDRILDKISEGGLHSLTDKEKKILREASER